MRKYSSVRASAKLLGGMMQTSDADVDEALLVEVLRVDHRAVDVGEDLELGRAADVVAVARSAVADDLVAVGRKAHLAGLERLDHAVLLGHAADPFVALDAHREGRLGGIGIVESARRVAGLSVHGAAPSARCCGKPRLQARERLANRRAHRDLRVRVAVGLAGFALALLDHRTRCRMRHARTTACGATARCRPRGRRT